MAKRFLRKRQVAERYGVHERSIDRMAEDGRLPPPHFHGGRIPRWDEDELDACDRAATRERAVKRTGTSSRTRVCEQVNLFPALEVHRKAEVDRDIRSLATRTRLDGAGGALTGNESYADLVQSAPSRPGAEFKPSGRK